MVALPTDVSRSGKPAKAAFENVFSAMVKLLERSVKTRPSSRPAQARAIAALWQLLGAADHRSRHRRLHNSQTSHRISERDVPRTWCEGCSEDMEIPYANKRSARNQGRRCQPQNT
jgi:hypothetical protein